MIAVSSRTSRSPKRSSTEITTTNGSSTAWTFTRPESRRKRRKKKKHKPKSSNKSMKRGGRAINLTEPVAHNKKRIAESETLFSFS